MRTEIQPNLPGFVRLTEPDERKLSELIAERNTKRRLAAKWESEIARLDREIAVFARNASQSTPASEPKPKPWATNTPTNKVRKWMALRWEAQRRSTFTAADVRQMTGLSPGSALSVISGLCRSGECVVVHRGKAGSKVDVSIFAPSDKFLGLDK